MLLDAHGFGPLLFPVVGAFGAFFNKLDAELKIFDAFSNESVCPACSLMTNEERRGSKRLPREPVTGLFLYNNVVKLVNSILTLSPFIGYMCTLISYLYRTGYKRAHISCAHRIYNVHTVYMI